MTTYNGDNWVKKKKNIRVCPCSSVSWRKCPVEKSRQEIASSQKALLAMTRLGNLFIYRPLVALFYCAYYGFAFVFLTAGIVFSVEALSRQNDTIMQVGALKGHDDERGKS